MLRLWVKLDVVRYFSSVTKFFRKRWTNSFESQKLNLVVTTVCYTAYGWCSHVIQHQVHRSISPGIQLSDLVCVCVCVCVCVFYRDMQIASSQRHVTLPCVASLSVPRFLHISSQTPEISKKALSKIKCVLFIFSVTFVCNISHSKKNWAQCDRKCVSVIMCSTGCACLSYCNVYRSSCAVPVVPVCHIVMKLGISQQIFEKSRYLNN